MFYEVRKSSDRRLTDAGFRFEVLGRSDHDVQGLVLVRVAVCRSLPLARVVAAALLAHDNLLGEADAVRFTALPEGLGDDVTAIDADAS
jgi:hypothetical protein